MINCENYLEAAIRSILIFWIVKDMLSMKNVNWYQVALGLTSLDDAFENAIMQELRDVVFSLIPISLNMD